MVARLCWLIRWRLLGQRAVQADDITAGEQLVERHITHAEALQFRVGEGVVQLHLAAETEHDPREHSADLPAADHADALAHQIETGQPLQREIALAGTVVGPWQAPVECQDQRHGVLGHRMRRIGRHPYYRQAEALGTGQIDVVVAGRTQGDQPRASSGEPLQHGRRQHVIDERADHLSARGQRHGVGIEARFEELQLEAMCLIGGPEAVTVVGLAAEQGDTHREPR